MNLLDKAIAFVAPKAALHRMQAREALHQFRHHAAAPGRERPRTPAVGNMSPNTSSAQRDRVQLMWEARELVDNFALVKGLLLKLALYTFGSVRYEPQTTSDEANAAYKKYFEDWTKVCDISGRHNLTSLLNLYFIAMLRDGDTGVNMRLTDKGWRLQSVEADRIGRPTDTTGGETHIGGIDFDPETGTPLAYHVFERSREGMYRNPVEVPACQFIHLFDPLRVDQARGFTALDAAIDTARDIYDIFRFEKFAVKWASAQTGVVKTEEGEGEWTEGGDVDGDGNRLESIEFGKVNYLRNGEDISTFRSERPSATFSGFMEALQRDICFSLGIPYGFFINNSSLGGAAGRLDSQQANRVCSRFQEFFKDKFLERIKDAVIAYGISFGGLPAVPDWKSGKWQFPAWPSADVGRESSANIEEWKLGMRTASDIYGERSESWREQFRQKAIEMKELMALAKEMGVPLDMLCALNPNPQTQPGAGQPGQPPAPGGVRAPNPPGASLFTK